MEPWILCLPCVSLYVSTATSLAFGLRVAQSGLMLGPFSVSGGCFGIADGERSLFGLSCEGQQVSVTSS